MTCFGTCALCEHRQKLPKSKLIVHHCRDCGGILMPSERALEDGHLDPRPPPIRRCQRCNCILRSTNMRDNCAPCDKSILDGLPLVDRSKLLEERRKQDGLQQENKEPEPELEGALASAVRPNHSQWW